MKIYLNEKELDKSYQSSTLPDLLASIKDDLDDEILRQIFVNGVKVNEKYLRESFLDKEDIQSIKFTTQKIEVLINETLQQAEEYLPKLKNGIMDTANCFRNGESKETNERYQQILKGVEWFIKAMTKILSIKGNDDLYKESQELIGGLNKSLTELMKAYNKNDIVLVADILEYKIIDYIDEFILINNKLLGEY